jgi:hypothetical protein
MFDKWSISHMYLLCWLFSFAIYPVHIVARKYLPVAKIRKEKEQQLRKS